MSRFVSTAIAALTLGAALAVPVMAQQAKPAPASVQSTIPADSPVPGSEEWERQRGETYRPVPDSRQDPEELATTSKLNAAMTAQNEAAAQAEAAIIASNDAAREAWQAEAARIEADNARIAAENAAAQERYQRDMALYEQSVRACEQAGGRNCRIKP
ncbi:MAG: hypothetical protein DCF29_12760 [Alphaproteobacteria bacterium]|nr:MAG: hypothetical protein DCF29_12760 [Alphaproteobacteria bacterium]